MRLGPDAAAALGTAGRPGRAIHLAAPDDARLQLAQEAAGFGMVSPFDLVPPYFDLIEHDHHLMAVK